MLTKEQIAKKLGANTNTVCCWFRADKTPGEKRANDLEALTGIKATTMRFGDKYDRQIAWARYEIAGLIKAQAEEKAKAVMVS